jgi:transcriptional regulator with XRE-family HTH domain
MLIQKLRLQRGWSQEQLAELSGLSTRTIQRLERGQPASVETLKALGAVFDVDFSTLKEPDMSNAAEVPAPTAAASPEHIEEALAFAHVRAMKGFYVHASLYLMVMTFLVILNLVVTPHFFWAIFPILGWGIGVAFHGLRVFDMIPLLTGDWEKREVEKRLGRKL